MTTGTPMETQDFIRLSRARAEIVAAKTADDAKGIRDKAEAARAYARKIGLSRDAHNDLGEIIVEASARAGELLEEAKKTGQRDPGGRGKRIESRDATQLKDLGITRSDSSRWQLVATLTPEERAKYYAETREARGDITTAGVLRVAKSKARGQRLSRRENDAILAAEGKENYQLICSPVADLAQHIEAESIDAIVTDPPYPEEFLPVYSDLAKLAVHALKPSGVLLVMTGQSHLPEVLRRLTEDPALRYHWTLAYVTPGCSTQVWGRKVKSNCKPVLLFSKGKYAGENFWDLIKLEADDGDKRFHEWGQSVAGTAQIIERFTVAGETVLDPFLGGGATAVAALQQKRQFIGAEVGVDAIRIAKDRLAAAGGAR